MRKILTNIFAITAGLLTIAATDLSAAPGDLKTVIKAPQQVDYLGSGSSVAVTPDGQLLVSTPDRVYAENAYLINTQTGQVGIIENPNPGERDDFGYAVAVTPQGHLIIAARNIDAPYPDSGVVYVFDGETRELLHTITSPNVAIDDHFGAVIASTSNGNILISAPKDINELYRGAVYLYDVESGNLLHTYVNPDSIGSNDNFGRALVGGVNGEVLIGDSSRGMIDDVEAVYVYHGQEQYYQLKYTIENPGSGRETGFGDNFGKVLAVMPDGDYVVGAGSASNMLGEDFTDRGAGIVYVFDRESGEQLISISNPADYEHPFGFTLATTANRNILIGSGRAADGYTYLYDSAGTLLHTFVSDFDYNFIDTVAVMPNGDLVVAHTGSFGTGYICTRSCVYLCGIRE